MDLSLTGFEMFFKDYQIQTLETLWETDTGLLSVEVWKQVNNKRTTPISRASIINFLQDLCQAKVLRGEVETGKGGQRTRYFAKREKGEFKSYLKKLVKTKLDELIARANLR